MLERLTPYLRPPVFPDDEDKTFTASLLHVILWSVLVGVCLYTFIATIFSLIQPDMFLIAWLYVLALVALTLTLMAVMRRGNVQRAAISINLGLWIILTSAAYFNGGVIAPAYSGYLIVITCTCLLVSWQWGTVAAIASALAGAVFLLAATNNWLPDWIPTYSPEAVWIANVAYFLIITMLLTLALRTIKRAAQQARLEMAERLKTEQALSNSEQRFRAIFDSVNDAIFVQEFSAGRILDVNQKMCEMYGYTVEEARRLTIEDLSAGAAPYRQQDVSDKWRKTAEGEPQVFEWHARDRAGRLFWVEVNMRRAVIDGQDRLLVVVRDIDERKRTTERERQTSAGLRAVIEATQELMNCADLDTLYQRSVELAREKIGVERCGLYVLEEGERFLRGTFGTDDQGRTTDERPTRNPLEDHPEVSALTDQLWASYDKPFTFWKDGHAQVLPDKGWNAATPIRSRNRLVGVLYNDTALTHAPLDETLQEVVAVYGSLLGSLIELKRAEADLAHERDWLQLLMDNFPDTIYFKDSASRFTRINRAQTKLLGLTVAEEAIGKTDVDFFQSDELAQSFLAEEQHLMSSGEPIIDRVEYNPTPTGQPRWLSASKVPLRDASGQIVGLVGISRDITDRMLAEQREKTISQGLRAVIDATQELINCADLDMLYRRSVELAREKLGLERCGLHLLDEDQQHLLGTYGTDDRGQTSDERQARVLITERSEVFTVPDRLWNVLHKSFNYLREGAVQVLPQSGWIAATPLRSRRQNIGMFYNDTALSNKPLDQIQQEVVAVYCSLLGSLIELKHTEAKLAHERDLLQSLMDNIPDAIYFKDTASRFTHVNQAMIRILELHEPSEAVGKADAEFFSSRLKQLYLDEERELLRTGQPLLDRLEYNPTNDGRPRWFSASKVPLRDAGGQIAGMVGISRDVTERVLAQRRDQTISQGLRAVIEAADELMSCTDLDTLYRRAVELAREKLAVERCGLFALDEQGWLRGTYGTDLQQRTSDERGAHFAPIDLAGLDAASDQLWTLIDSEHAFWEGDVHQVFGTGWVGATFIRTRDRVMGVLYNDTAITQTPVNEAQQEVLAVYCSLLGSLIELKHAERERQESELLYRRAIGAAGAVPYYLDYATEAYGFVGEGIQAMTGLLPGEMQPTMWDTLIVEAHPLGQARDLPLPEAVHETRAGHINEWRCDYRIRRPDGQERWITDASIQVVDEQGQPRGAIGILQDITERKQAEAAVQESEALFRQLAESAPALIALTDEHGLATYLNRAWREFRGEVPSLPLDEWSAQIHPSDRERYLHEFQSALQARRKITIEYRLRRADGQYRWLLDTMVPRYAADERFSGLIGIAIDMTDRKNVEESLRRSESQMRLLTENMVDTISQIDAQYGVLYVSPSIQRELGYRPTDLLGRRLLDVLHPDDARTFYHQMIMAATLRAPTLRLIYRQRHAAGHYLWIESEIQLLYADDGEFTGAVFGSRDVSTRQQAEAEREVVIKELEEKNAELERFTYTVSHDLKSPLITIRGFLGFLEKDAVSGNFDRLHADIGRIADATTRMQRLLDELLSLSRVGRLTNAPQEIAFEALAREAVELVQGRIMARGVQVDIAENLPAVYGDYARLVEVMQNLIDNAVKFMGDQPEPRITIGVLASDREGLPIFFVQDNGVGIDPSYHERVFGLFNKLDAQSEGTGVGLALVKRIIEVHGGHIWVESDGVGQGAMFLFTLPQRGMRLLDKE